MRALAVLSCWVLVLPACAPVARPVAHTRADGSDAVPVARAVKLEPPTPPAERTLITASERLRATNATISGISFEGVAFDSRKHRLVVVDQPGGPGSRFADATEAGRSNDALVAVNAGFFTPEGEPLGMVVSDGKGSGYWNSASSLGSGVWFETPSGKSAIRRRGQFGRADASSMRQLIQSGPMLVENGRTVGGLNDVKVSVRTVILWDGGVRWWIGRASGCTLAELGRALGSGQPAGWSVHQALNLDGGRSSDLWISNEVPGGPVTRRSPWNRPVRNFLILKPR